MKKVILTTALNAVFLAISFIAASQTFSSNLQRDITPSGLDKLGSHPVTIVLSKDKSTVTITYKGLKPDTYRITYYRSTDKADQVRTMYTIDNNPFFQALYFFEYKSQHEIEFENAVYRYRYNLTFAQQNSDGSTNHSTSFFSNKIK